MKLPKKHALIISRAFNAVIVAKMMKADPNYSYDLWEAHEQEAWDTLKQYGILPSAMVTED